MVSVDVISLLWAILAFVGVVGLLMVGSAFVTGWLVFRTKREQHERLLVDRAKPTGKPIVIDEFGAEEGPVDELVRKQDDIMSRRNKKFMSLFSTDQIKERTNA